MLHDISADLTPLRDRIIRASASAQEGHIPSAFSILDILWVLYSHVLDVSPDYSRDKDRDFFILSKGHASLGLYAVLAEKGFFPSEYLNDFAGYNSLLGGHPDRNKVPGVEASTGSLGHGFPIALGVAMGLKIKKKAQRVFVIVGDGECNEGTIWETALLAAHHGLDNLVCIVDYNHSTDRALKIGDVASKFAAFGWKALNVDGHNHNEIYQALTSPHTGVPLVVVAETIKGKGCAPMENQPAWHHRSPKSDEVDSLLAAMNVGRNH